MLEAKQQEWSLRRKEAKPKIMEAHIKTIQSSHAVIDGQGFRMLTQEDKKQQIEEYLKKCRQEEMYEQERIRHSKPKSLLDYF